MSTLSTIPRSTLTLTLRPLAGRDPTEVAQLARATHVVPWLEPEALRLLPPAARRGWVAEAAHRLAGFVLCTVSWLDDCPAGGVLPALSDLFRELVGKRVLPPLQVKLIDLCVAAEWPRPVVERALMGQLEAELRQLRDYLQIVVPESNLPAQLFLHELDYRATEVLRGYYGSEDGYRMVSPPTPARQAEPIPFLTRRGTGVS